MPYRERETHQSQPGGHKGAWKKVSLSEYSLSLNISALFGILTMAKR